MTTSSPINPYEPPREPALPANFSDRDAVELADLRRRVGELERQVGRSWLVHGNLFQKVLAVWGYLLLGYVMVLSVAFSVMLIIRMVTGDWLNPQ